MRARTREKNEKITTNAIHMHVAERKMEEKQKCCLSETHADDRNLTYFSVVLS